MAAFTLAEYKIGTDDFRKAGIVQTYLNNAPFLNHIKNENITGSTIKVVREKTLPSVGFRAVNADWTRASGEIEEISEDLKICGGGMTIDRFVLKTQGAGRAGVDEMMRVKAIARTMSETFFKGDGTGNSFTGLQSRVAAGQTVSNGTAGLSLGSLDEAIAELEGDNRVIYCNTTMYSKFAQAMRNPAIAGNIYFTPDEFGREAMYYNGVPIIKAGRDTSDAEILDFSETGSTTSLYCVSHDSNGVIGAQNGELNYFDMDGGKSVTSKYDIEWYWNFVLQQARAAIRVDEITNAAMTA
jgi:hypothetical protein